MRRFLFSTLEWIVIAPIFLVPCYLAISFCAWRLDWPVDVVSFFLRIGSWPAPGRTVFLMGVILVCGYIVCGVLEDREATEKMKAEQKQMDEEHQAKYEQACRDQSATRGSEF